METIITIIILVVIAWIIITAFLGYGSTWHGTIRYPTTLENIIDECKKYSIPQYAKDDPKERLKYYEELVESIKQSPNGEFNNNYHQKKLKKLLKKYPELEKLSTVTPLWEITTWDNVDGILKFTECPKCGSNITNMDRSTKDWDRDVCAFCQKCDWQYHYIETGMKKYSTSKKGQI